MNQGDNIQSFHTSFPILNQSVVPCKVLTVASWPVYRFLRRLVRWSGIPISWRIFQFVVIHTVKGFCVGTEAEVDAFLEFPRFLYDTTNVGQLISGSSAFSKSNLSIWKFLTQILLKSSLKDFEHKFTSMWHKHNCMVVGTIFGIYLLCNWDESWIFLVLWPLLSFPNMLTYWVWQFNSIIF